MCGGGGGGIQRRKSTVISIDDDVMMTPSVWPPPNLIDDVASVFGDMTYSWPEAAAAPTAVNQSRKRNVMAPAAVSNINHTSNNVLWL